MVENAFVHLSITSCSLDGFSAMGKVHQSPSAKNVPPARFFNGVRLKHGRHPTLSFTYFEPDGYKEGGRYLTRIGIVKKVDSFAKKLILYGSDDIENKKIPTIDLQLDRIIDISGFPAKFDEYEN